MKKIRLVLPGLAALLIVALASIGLSSPGGAAGANPVPARAPLPWIDTHAHPVGGPGSTATCFSAECLGRTLAMMDQLGIQKMLLMPPPAPAEGNASIEEQLPGAVQRYPDRFAFLAGGQTINGIIQQAGRRGQVTTAMRQRVEARAADLIRMGAVGFGETAAMHLSYNESHAFEQTPPDHALFLLLADLAARYDVPIDLHMDPVAEDMPTPQWFQQASSRNPATLQGNVGGLERLLAHDRNTRIVWAHAGRDTTGQMPVEALRRLLEAHPNLYLQIVIVPRSVEFIHNTPLDPSGILRPEWEDLIRSFPDRFVLGSDAFLARARDSDVVESTGALLEQLPPELARMVGYENAVRIYRLGDSVAGDSSSR